jgi:UrcA family protein
MMKTFPTAHALRTTIISVAAASAIALPLFASASSSNTVDVFFNQTELVSTSTHEELYAKLEDASRKICGSSNLNITGSVRRSAGIEECYEGTLTAAVERLDNADISALHNQ